MLITATWRVTLSGVVLLDFGDYMDAEPELVPSGELEVVPLIDAAAPFIQGRGNVLRTLRFSRVKPCTDDAAARAFLITHNAELPLCAAPAVATIELLRGGTLNFAGAVLQSAGRPTTESELFLAQYTLLGGALTYTNALLNQDGTPLLNEDGTPLINA